MYILIYIHIYIYIRIPIYIYIYIYTYIYIVFAAFFLHQNTATHCNTLQQNEARTSEMLASVVFF